MIQQVISDGKGSAVVSWNPPEDANGIIRKYTVDFFYLVDHYDFVDGSINFDNMTNLEDCVTYDITVMAENLAGQGDESDSYHALISSNGM